jgi:hypothetical protein
MEPEDSDFVTTVGPDGNPSPVRAHLRVSPGPRESSPGDTPTTSETGSVPSDVRVLHGDAPRLSAANLVDRASGSESLGSREGRQTPSQLASPQLNAIQPTHSLSPPIGSSPGDVALYIQRREFLTKGATPEFLSSSAPGQLDPLPPGGKCDEDDKVTKESDEAFGAVLDPPGTFSHSSRLAGSTCMRLVSPEATTSMQERHLSLQLCSTKLLGHINAKVRFLLPLACLNPHCAFHDGLLFAGHAPLP